jgi:uncharacterized protein (TIGR03435 family)
MLKIFACVAVLLPCAVFAQSEKQATFEIADVHASPRTLHPARRTGFHAGRFELAMATMTDLVAAAYGVERDNVFGGPDWLDLDRFDVIARAPDGTSQQALRVMLQSLLAERFQLVVHMDQKPRAGYLLSTGSGKPNMKESNSGPPGCQRLPQPAEAGPIPAVCHGLTMAAFASQLSGAAGDYLNGPVVDDTKLEGAWDFTLKWTPRGRLADAEADGINIFDAIDKQLGLKLEAKQIPMPVLVVDRVNRKPAENPPGVLASLPVARPPQFEVATIKPTDPQFQGMKVQMPPNGQVNLQGVTLSFMIQNIWFITPEMIVDAPKWLDVDRWDIVAKVATAPGVSRAYRGSLQAEDAHGRKSGACVYAHCAEAEIAARRRCGPHRLQGGSGGGRKGSQDCESGADAAGYVPQYDDGAICAAVAGDR